MRLQLYLFFILIFYINVCNNLYSLVIQAVFKTADHVGGS